MTVTKAKLSQMTEFSRVFVLKKFVEGVYYHVAKD